MRPTLATLFYALALSVTPAAWAASPVMALSAKPADIILAGGAILVEADESTAKGEKTTFAQAVALRNGEILAVGTRETVLRMKSDSTRWIDLKGRVAMPAFHDGFVNLAQGGLKLLPVDADRTTAQARRQAILKAQDTLMAAGITSVSGPVSADDVLTLQELALEGKISLRFELWGELEKAAQFRELKEKNQRSLPLDFIRFGGVYGELDGSLVDRTAALLDPYADERSSQGQPRYTQERLNALVISANRQGLAVILKASGDRAVNMAITAFGNARKQLFNGRIRNRIVGADLVSSHVRPRFGDLNIALIADPDMLLTEEGGTNMGDLVVRRLGRERARNAYSWRSLADANAHIGFGSSWPARAVNPLLSLYAAVVRPGLPSSNEGLRVSDALRAYTMGAAFATKEEHVKGSIREGKYADIVVLSQNPFKVKAADLRKIMVDLTIAGGKVVYDREAEAAASRLGGGLQPGIDSTAFAVPSAQKTASKAKKRR